jgi:hypothetical protein
MIRAALKALLMMILVGSGGSALLFSVVFDYSGTFGFLEIPGALALVGGMVLLVSILRQVDGVVSRAFQVAPVAEAEAPHRGDPGA